MKDQLNEILMRLFDQSLNELSQTEESHTEAPSAIDYKLLALQEPSEHACRIFTDEERMHMTRASQQLLVRLRQMNVLCHDHFELVLEHLQIEHEHLVGLQETKWTVRKVLSQILDEYQLAFLDLVLYQKEYDITAH